MSKKLTYLSLFSGMGGLDFGLESAGFTNIGCVEQDNDACEILRSNTKWNVIQEDIRETNFLSIIKKAGIKRTEIDLIVGGPPCQSYSKSSFWTSNVRRGYADKRGKLIDQYMRSVEELLPKVFLIENVPGFCYSKQSGGMDSIKRSLARIKAKTGFTYNVAFKVLNCAEYGVPQKRERFFLIANRLGQDFEFPKSTHGLLSSNEVKQGKLKPYSTVANAFHSLDYSILGEDVKVGGRWKDLLPCIPPGSNYQFFTDKGLGKSLFKYRSRYWTFLLKLSPQEPSWTIQASPGSSTGPFHWENRKLYSRELARLQTIPDWVKLTIKPRVNHRLIGNAVPSLIGEILGKEIKKQIFEQRVLARYQLLPELSTITPRASYKKTLPKFLPLC